METEGRSFEKAEVTKIIKDNIGGKKGISSILGLAFTMLCIFFLFLPMIYQGVSPIAAAIFIILFTTVVTMILIDGVSRKSTAVMDVGMSISSTLHELKEKNPSLKKKELFASGMNVGRDMMGTMSNTLILAFTGGSINTLVFLYSYNYEYLQMINMYSVGIELMQGLSASMGVILTVPFTSAAAAWILCAGENNRTCGTNR